MTDNPTDEFVMDEFEMGLMRRMERYAASSDRSFDADVLTAAAAGRAATKGWTLWPGRQSAGTFGRPALSAAWMLLLYTLLLALAAAALVAGAILLRDRDRQRLPINGRIVYGSAYRGIEDTTGGPIRLANADGSPGASLTNGYCGAYSHDGRVLLLATPMRGNSNRASISVADPEGNNVRPIGDVDRFQTAQISPDGTYVLDLERDFSPKTSELWLISTADGSRRQLVPDPQIPEPRVGGRYISTAAWSPDGKSIAYDVMQEIGNADNSGGYRAAIDIVDVTTGNVRRLTDRPGTDFVAIAWSPDGKSLAFLALPDWAPLPVLDPDGGFSVYPTQDVFTIDFDGTNERNLTNSPADRDGLSWSPAGNAIAQQVYDGTTHQLAVIKLDGSRSPRPFNLTSFDPDGLSNLIGWSPDGSSLVMTVPSSGPKPDENAFSPVAIALMEPALASAPAILLDPPGGVGCFSWQGVWP